MWTGDNLDILRGMNSQTVDLIYLDPPFNSNKTYSAPIGSQAAGAAFKDTWTLDDVDLAWHGEIAEQSPALYSIIDAAGLSHGKGMKSYLIMMAVRLLELKRVLKDTGSLYLHCDPTASHYLKMLLDAVFGKDQFQNEVVWCYDTAGRTKKKWNKKHDLMLFYSKTKDFFFRETRTVRMNLTEGWESWYPHTDEEGRRYQIDGKGYTYYADAGRLANDWWADIRALHANRDSERTGYPTQKPLKLLERIITTSSPKQGIILDPFCGCATALVAAEKLGRKWIGIDLSAKAAELVRIRMEKETDLLTTFDLIHRTDVPARTDLEKVPHYRTQKHTLYGKQEGLCNGCQTLFHIRNFTVDHQVPQAKGGSDHLDNLQLLCGMCNSTKGTGTQAELKAKLKRQGVLG